MPCGSSGRSNGWFGQRMAPRPRSLATKRQRADRRVDRAMNEMAAGGGVGMATSEDGASDARLERCAIVRWADCGKVVSVESQHKDVAPRD